MRRRNMNQGRFETITRQIIRLANARWEEDRAHSEHHGDLLDELAEGLDREKTFGALALERPREFALRETLRALDPMDLRKLDIVRRAGENDEEVLGLSKLRFDHHRNHVALAYELAARLSLAEDLENGLVIARRDGVDLDADFWPDSEPNMIVRYFSVYWDRAVPARAGAAGLLLIESLMEDTKDVSNLVDQGLFFNEEDRVDRLRKLLAKNLGCSIDEIEIDEPNEE